jgi:hypothetical protein
VPWGLIQAIEGAQDVQAEMLNAIHADIDLLRLRAFRSGKVRLHEAARVNPQCERRTTLLNEAASRFLDAESMCSCLEEGAVNQFHLELTFGLLNNRADASYWLGASAACGTAAARAFAEAAGSIKVLKSEKAVAVTALLFCPAGATFLLKKRKRKMKRKQDAHAAAHALGEFLLFCEHGSVLSQCIAGRGPHFHPGAEPDWEDHVDASRFLVTVGWRHSGPHPTPCTTGRHAN